MKHRRCRLVNTDSGSPKVRALIFLGHMEDRTAGVYENQVPVDVLKYLYKKKLIRVEKMYRGGRCTRNVVYLNYDPTPKEKRKPEPYKKRKQRIIDDAAYQKRK